MFISSKYTSHGTCITLTKAIRLGCSDSEAESKAKLLQEQRKQFYAFCCNPPYFQYFTDRDNALQVQRAYLSQSYDILELISSTSNLEWKPSYFSALSEGHPTFQIDEGGEIGATAEIIMSRYAYVFSRLNMSNHVYENLHTQCRPGNFEALSNDLKYLIEMAEDVCIRFSKFLNGRDLIWTPLEQVGDKYLNYPEMNYHNVEGFYL